jgi:hypothetical protein
MKSNSSSINVDSVPISMKGVSTIALFTKRLCSTFGFAVLAAVWSINDPYNGGQMDSEYSMDQGISSQKNAIVLFHSTV